MSSAALQDLANRIATNTLTAQQQGALIGALGTIIPVFPNPDELSNSIPQFEEDLARLWYATLYSLNADGGIPLPPVVSDVTGTAPIVVTPVGSARVVSITAATDGAAGSMSAADKTKLDTLAPGVFSSVANAAALTAEVLTGFPLGALAFVATYGALFSLQPVTALKADVVLASSSGSLVWVRSTSVIAATAQAQTAWFVDAAAGDNQATGLTTGTAIKTKSELLRRWGTSSPTLDGVNVVITYKSADATPDTGTFEPLFANGATLTHVGLAPQTFTGTLLAVTAKNLTAVPANGLGSTFTTTTGAIAVGQILTNTTRANSQARVVASLGAGVFAISQPLQNWTPGAFPATNVDTWANGDAIVGTTPLKLDIARIGGLVGSYNGVTFTAHTAQGIEFVDPTGDGGMLQIDGNSNFLLVHCSWSTRSPSLHGGSSVAGQFWNCISSAVSVFNPDVSESVWSAGAFLSSTDVENMGFSNVPTLGGTTPLMRVFGGDDLPTFIVMIAGSKVRVESHWQVLAGGGFAGAITTTVDSVGGAVVYNDTAAHVLNVATLQIQGISTAYSVETTAGATLVGTLAVSAANLDAAAGIGTGAGGMLFNPAGGGYLRQGVTP